MKYRIVLIVVMILLPLICPAQEIKLPVFFLYYDGGVGSEEIELKEGEEEIEATSLSTANFFFSRCTLFVYNR